MEMEVTAKEKIVTIEEIETWADSVGYAADSRLGVYPFGDGRQLWVIEGDHETGAPIVVVDDEISVTLHRAHDDYWKASGSFVAAVLRLGGTIEWADPVDGAGRSIVVVQLPSAAGGTIIVALEELRGWFDRTLSPLVGVLVDAIETWVIGIRTWLVMHQGVEIRHPLELRVGRDIYVPTESYDAVVQTIAGPSWWRPEWIVVETDLFKLSIYAGSRKERRDMKRTNWRWKKPYLRIRQEFLPSVAIVAVRDGGERVHMVDPYGDAVDRVKAASVMFDRRSFEPVETVERLQVGREADGWPILEPYETTHARALTRALKLNEIRHEDAS